MKRTRSRPFAGYMPPWWRARSWLTSLFCSRSRCPIVNNTMRKVDGWPPLRYSGGKPSSGFGPPLPPTPRRCAIHSNWPWMRARWTSAEVSCPESVPGCTLPTGTARSPPTGCHRDLRAAFELPFTAREATMPWTELPAWLPRLYPYIPRRLRYVGPYYEAEARLTGRPPAS